ncbi:unnamed protein product [Ectocarpus sp. CCAP 1310/34]|nr:unnamed protein product [Ectocarpus sp. CCAP 1310/34]
MDFALPMVLKVILTDADVAMTSAVASDWKGTQHLFCLWHVNKNLVKKCAGALSDQHRTRMLRSFRSAAYAVNAEVRFEASSPAPGTLFRSKLSDCLGSYLIQTWPNMALPVATRHRCAYFQAFASSRGQMEQISAGTKCEEYVDNLFKNKSKWAFYCRTTTLALGMAATQRVEGLFSVPKCMGVIKQLSLCALWDVLRRVDTSLAIELATPAIAAQLPFQEKHMENFFTPINEGLQRVGASQFCTRDVRRELGGSQSYDVERIGDRQPAQDPVKVGQIFDLRERLNLLQPPPPATDLESVNTAEALEIQRAVDECVKFQLIKRLGIFDGTAIGPGNPEMAPKKGGPKGSTKQATGTIGQSEARSRNPEGQMGTTLKKTRFRDSYGPGSGRGRRARGDGQSASGNAS